MGSTLKVQFSDHNKTENQVFSVFDKFLILVSVESKLITYHRVVVVLREMAIDYESMYTYSLTKDTLIQI